MRRTLRIGTLGLLIATGACSSSSTNPTDDGAASGGTSGVDASNTGGAAGLDAGDAGGGTPGDGSVDVDAAGTSYADEVLADQPSLYWRELGPAPTVVDASGNGNDGTFAGCVNSVDTPEGKAIELCGGYLQAGNIFPFLGKAPSTFEAWIKVGIQTSLFARLVSKEATSGDRAGWDVMLNGNNQDGGPADIYFERWQADVSYSAVVPDGMSLFSSETFAHFVATYDGITSRVYVNAVSQAEKVSNASIGPTDGNLHVGADANNSSKFVGVLDEIAIYETALDPSRIKAHYDRALAVGR